SGPGMGHGAVSGNARREPRETRRVTAHGDLLDALVDVPEVLFQVDDDLAHGLEAEVSRLDDAGMHRSHRDLDDARSVGGSERIIAVRRRAARRGLSRVIAAQRELLLAPRLVPDPAAVVRLIGKDDAEEIV